MLDINFIKNITADNQAIILLISDQLKLDSYMIELDRQYNGVISKTIQNKDVFSGKFQQTKTLTVSESNGNLKQFVLIGTGDELKLTVPCIEKLGGAIYAISNNIKAKYVEIALSGKIGSIERDKSAIHLASGASLASYRFDKYRTIEKDENKIFVSEIAITVDDIEGVETDFTIEQAMVQGVFTARDYVSEPPNVLYPESYAKMIVEDFDPLDIEVEVRGEREMKNLGMGALVGVGQGSQQESKLVVMKYFGSDDEDESPIAFVGKGVTFDTGGISIKPANNMWDMKYDMAGSASVVGLIKTLALRKAKVNVVGVIGLVENMPSGNAQRPSDVVKTMSGLTAEVLNTDAEGRLVLADALYYAQEKFQPKCVIDLATLTGAISIALGNVYAGCFSNDDKLAEQLIAAGKNVDEKLWRMPLHSEYDKMLNSDIADIANISTSSGGAGSSVAAQFLARFIKKDVIWAHLDIASVAWEKKGKAICPKGAVGYGIRLLNKFVQDNYEA